MSIIAVYSIKGGVGKTSTAVNLAHLSAREGIMTLLCDMDSQGSASYYFRIRPPRGFDITRLLKGGPHVESGIRGTDFELLDLLPADFSFRNIDIALDGLKGRRKRLRRLLAPLRDDYGHIVLDCPPNLSLLSENLFAAADLILVPVIPTTLSRLALERLLAFLKERRINRGKVLPFFSMAEQRKTMHVDMMVRLRADFPTFADTVIPYLAEVEKMGVHRKPVTAFAPRSRAARAYERLWREVKAHPRVLG